ncbi:MAG: amino acid ABC transporter permease [Planctomycetes bacterium]|nr:amino acid ABC transporter permease [Planctomycetota bacterium]
MEAFGKYLTEQIFIWDLLRASKYPLILTALSMPIAVCFGMVLALMRMSRFKVISWAAAGYIEVMRGTPLLVQMFLVYYSLPTLGRMLDTDWLTLNNFTASVVCLSANYAAYEAEIHRAGLEAVDRGQREAALSIGMSERQSFLLVVLPQAFRIVLPPIINDLIAMLKDSCLASVLGVPELLTTAAGIGKARLNLEEMYVAASILYMLMSLACYAFGKWIEKKLKASGTPELNLEQARH